MGLPLVTSGRRPPATIGPGPGRANTVVDHLCHSLCNLLNGGTAPRIIPGVLTVNAPSTPHGSSSVALNVDTVENAGNDLTGVTVLTSLIRHPTLHITAVASGPTLGLTTDNHLNGSVSSLPGAKPLCIAVVVSIVVPIASGAAHAIPPLDMPTGLP